MLGPKVFPMEAAGKGSNITNQAKVIKPGFWGGETLGKNRGLGGGERLRGDFNNRVDWGVGTEVNVGRTNLVFN